VTVPRVCVVIGCDTDPDRAGFLDGVPHDRLTWRGMTEGIPAVKELLRGVADSRGHEPVFTWLLRADEQVRDLEGGYDWVPKHHGPLLRSLEATGDEIGWHPHFWRREVAGGPWFQEIVDVDWQVDMLQRAHAGLTAALPHPVRSVRMGWDYHNNRTYAALEALGITTEFSALPGMRTFRGTPPTRGENLFDWHSTPRAPYRPSRADYRRPARAGEAACDLLEVPNYVSDAALWGLVSGLQLARKTRALWQLWQAVRRPTYWIGVTARPAYFAPLVSHLGAALRRGGDGPVVFATYLHPDELLPNRSALYTLESVRANLEALLRACAESSAEVEFMQAGRIPELLSGSSAGAKAV
jgi:hypothetical protein